MLGSGNPFRGRESPQVLAEHRNAAAVPQRTKQARGMSADIRIRILKTIPEHRNRLVPNPSNQQVYGRPTDSGTRTFRSLLELVHRLGGIAALFQDASKEPFVTRRPYPRQRFSDRFNRLGGHEFAYHAQRKEQAAD
jgi:hypothetical protein